MNQTNKPRPETNKPMPKPTRKIQNQPLVFVSGQDLVVQRDIPAVSGTNNRKRHGSPSPLTLLLELERKALSAHGVGQRAPQVDASRHLVQSLGKMNIHRDRDPSPAFRRRILQCIRKSRTITYITNNLDDQDLSNIGMSNDNRRQFVGGN